MTIKVKKWKEFQHYKRRDPPWIRLYRKLLNDREWHKLTGDDAKMLVSLWLLASENEGCLPTVEDIAFRLRLPEQHIASTIERLGKHWLHRASTALSASTALADQEQDASPETESETYSESDSYQGGETL